MLLKVSIFKYPFIAIMAVWFGPVALCNLVYVLWKGSEFKGDLWFVVAMNVLAIPGALGLVLLKKWGRRIIAGVLLANMAYILYLIIHMLIETLPSDDAQSLGYPGLLVGTLILSAIFFTAFVCFRMLNSERITSIFS